MSDLEATQEALRILKGEIVLKVPKDIEGFLFKNKMDLNKFHHNESSTNTTQSL